MKIRINSNTPTGSKRLKLSELVHSTYQVPQPESFVVLAAHTVFISTRFLLSMLSHQWWLYAPGAASGALELISGLFP